MPSASIPWLRSSGMPSFVNAVLIVLSAFSPQNHLCETV
jgi:hypothetical protein